MRTRTRANNYAHSNDWTTRISTSDKLGITVQYKKYIRFFTYNIKSTSGTNGNTDKLMEGDINTLINRIIMFMLID